MQLSLNDQQPLNANKDRVSNNTAWTDNEETLELQLDLEVSDFEELCEAEQMLTSSIQQPQISDKLHRKAIKWLITNCWIKNIDDETLWLAIILYYSYYVAIVIPKQQIELILATSLYIASKFNQVNKLSVQEILELLPPNFCSNNIVEMEAEILENVNYRLDVANLVAAHAAKTREDKEVQTFFLLEVSFLKDASHFYHTQKFHTLLSISAHPEKPSPEKAVFLELLATKSAEIILQKYSSQFDTQQFIKKLSY